MHQDYVASRCSILDDLERYSINLFDAFVETGDPRSRIASGAQIPEVGMPSSETISATAHLEHRVAADSQKTTYARDDAVR